MPKKTELTLTLVSIAMIMIGALLAVFTPLTVIGAVVALLGSVLFFFINWGLLF